MLLTDFLELVKANGSEGALIGIVVLVAIYILKFTNLLKASWMRRLAAVILPVLLSGVKVGDDQSALLGLIATIIASFAYTSIELLISRGKQLIAPKA